MDSVAHDPDRRPARARRWLRRLPAALVVLAVVGVAAWQIMTRWQGGEAPPSYVLSEVTRGDIVAQVTATGTLSPVVQVEVGSQVSGRIKELFADYNSEVKAGQVIATIDSRLFQTAVSQARARLASARADLKRTEALAENSRLQYERTRGLGDRGVVAAAQIDEAQAARRSAEAQVVSARAEVTQAQAALEQAEINLAYTTIASPIDGVVVSRNVDVGQTVAASLSAPTLFVIAGDLRQMEVHTSVAESDVGQLVPGMRVEFTVDAYPDDTFVGAVKQVRYEAQAVSNVVTYDAVVQVENDALKLRPGMTANVTFIVDERRDVLVVSNRALRYRPAGAGNERGQRGQNSERGQRGERGERGEKGEKGERARWRVVWVLQDGKPAPVRIQVGLSDGTSTEVRGGELAEGDPVITGGANGTGQAGGSGPSQGGRMRPPRVL
jgi:HlyD family secretion protein